MHSRNVGRYLINLYEVVLSIFVLDEPRGITSPAGKVADRINLFLLIYTILDSSGIYTKISIKSQ